MIFDRNNSIGLLLLLTSTLFSIYLAELLLSAFLDEISYRINSLTGQTTRLQTARLHGATVDTRGVFQIAHDLDHEAVVRMSPTFIANNSGEMFALAGMSNRLTVQCNEFGSPVTYQSDEHGFRNPQGLYQAKKIDIALLGDSFTHGSCVPIDKDVSSLLRHDQHRVLNLGYSSNGPLIELATLREYAKPLAPKIILWMYYEGNDLKNLKHSEQKYKELLNYIRPEYSRNLINRQIEIDKKLAKMYLAYTKKHAHRLKSVLLSNKIISIIKLRQLRSIASKALRNFRKKLIDPLKYFARYPPDALFKQILQSANEEVTGWGGTLYFVYLPTWTRYTADFSDKNLSFRNEVLAEVQRLNIPIIDFHTELNQQADPLSFFPYRHLGHYTAEGHLLLANQIRSTISKKGE